MQKRTFIDKLIKDKDGKINIIEAPNPPIIGWLAFKLLGYIPVSTHLKSGFGFLSTAFVFLWAYLELTSGVNYLRRALGFVVLLAIIIPKFS
ncbi:hypothetical protein BH10PAT3_BH10PAT3_6190 [soil metagenome]